MEKNNNDLKTKKKPLVSIIDFLSGAAAGVTQTLVGQPFDMIKVRQQVLKQSVGDIISNVIKTDGYSGFYKGTASPLVLSAFCISFQIAGFKTAQRFFAKKNHDGDETKLSIAELALSGFFSGFCFSWLLSPMELFRIKMQMNTSEKYKSSFDAGLKIFKSQGIRGVWFGYYASTLRESIGSLIYFVVYETLIKYEIKRTQKKRTEISSSRIMVYGGIAGVSLWTANFPIDSIKSRQQSSDYTNSPYKSFNHTAKVMLREKGLRGMYNGLLVCQVRAFVVNAMSFIVLENSMNYLKTTRLNKL